MPGDSLDVATAERQRLTSVRLIAWVRWGGVAIAGADAFLATPAPVLGWVGVVACAAAMAAYNLPLSFLHRLPARWVEPLGFGALAGDFAACTAWMLLTSNDVFATTYAVFALVAIEAALLYRMRGTLVFIAAFLAAYGTFYWVRWHAFGFGVEPGSILFRSGIVAMIAMFTGALMEQSERRRRALTDVAERHAELHRTVAQQADRHSSVLQAISDVGEGLVITEAGRMIYGNDAYVRLTGYTQGELAAFGSLIELAPEEQRAELSARLAQRLAGRPAPFSYESQLVTKDGRVIDIETAMRLLPAEGSSRIIAVVRDISERKRAEAALQDSERVAHVAARRDPLTGIANRRAWDEEMDRAVARARRDGSPLSVALFDLDGFKEYNDDWGHLMGDRLLQAFAARWREALREADFIARHGGDEFAVLFHSASHADAALIVDRLRTAMPAQHTFSAGIAEWDGKETPEALMARADSALYETKRAGPGRVAEAGSVMARTPSWARLIPELLADREMDAVYQPICRLADRAVTGHEALARPSGFAASASVEGLFAAAQRLGYARDLDWLCRRVALERAAGLPERVPLFINVSVHALLDPLHDVDQMLLLARWAHRAAEDIVFEISERDPIRDLRRLVEVLEAYRQVGFRFAVDDVGEGHSTLEVLACARPEFIKVAGSLSGAAATAGARSAVMALVTFARSSGSEVIAEGLESERHLELMRHLGVTLGQGFALARPQRAPAPGGDKPLRLPAGVADRPDEADPVRVRAS